MEIDIEKFAEDKGVEIAKSILLMKNEYPYTIGKKVIGKGLFKGIRKGYLEGREERSIKAMIYTMSIDYAEAFLFENKTFVSDEKLYKFLKSSLSSKLKDSKKLEKMNLSELLGHLMEVFAIDFLLKNNVVIL